MSARPLPPHQTPWCRHPPAVSDPARRSFTPSRSQRLPLSAWIWPLMILNRVDLLYAIAPEQTDALTAFDGQVEVIEQHLGADGIEDLIKTKQGHESGSAGAGLTLAKAGGKGNGRQPLPLPAWLLCSAALAMRQRGHAPAVLGCHCVAADCVGDATAWQHQATPPGCGSVPARRAGRPFPHGLPAPSGGPRDRQHERR